MRVARTIHVALLTVGLSSGQVPSEKPLPVAWFSTRSRGIWADESQTDKPRILKPGDPIYRSSRLVRRDPKSASDAAWLSLPDGSYQCFACSQALVCDKSLDLSRVSQLAEPHLHALESVVNTMSGRRRPFRPMLHDGVADLTSGIPLGAIFDTGTEAGRYTIAWCLNGLSQKCPDEPVPLAVDWDPKEPDRVFHGSKVSPGLQRLVVLKKVEGDWFYTEEDAWVLLVQGTGAKSRVARVSLSLRSLREETKKLPDQASARVRDVALLAIEAEDAK